MLFSNITDNQFWRVMSDVLGFHSIEIPDWATRYAILRNCQVALWDIIESCERDGASSDTSIRAPELNDIVGFLKSHPSIGSVLLNGSRAASLFYKRVVGIPKVHVHALPSTSPRGTMSYAKKLARWRRVMRGVWA